MTQSTLVEKILDYLAFNRHQRFLSLITLDFQGVKRRNAMIRALKANLRRVRGQQ